MYINSLDNKLSKLNTCVFQNYNESEMKSESILRYDNSLVKLTLWLDLGTKPTLSG